MNRAHVLIGIPTLGSVSAMNAMALLAFARKRGWPQDLMHDDKVMVSFYMTNDSQPVERARNLIVNAFFDYKGGKDIRSGKEVIPYTHLFFIDSDTTPPTDALWKLLKHDKEIISGLTPILRLNDKDNKDKKEKDWFMTDNCWVRIRDVEGKVIKSQFVERNSGLHEIEACGASCLLIKREALEMIGKPYFKTTLNESCDEVSVSEDVYFCNMARKLGLKVYCDTSIICNHSKNIVL